MDTATAIFPLSLTRTSGNAMDQLQMHNIRFAWNDSLNGLQVIEWVDEQSFWLPTAQRCLRVYLRFRSSISMQILWMVFCQAGKRMFDNALSSHLVWNAHEHRTLCICLLLSISDIIALVIGMHRMSTEIPMSQSYCPIIVIVRQMTIDQFQDQLDAEHNAYKFQPKFTDAIYPSDSSNFVWQ